MTRTRRLTSNASFSASPLDFTIAGQLGIARRSDVFVDLSVHLLDWCIYSMSTVYWSHLPTILLAMAEQHIVQAT